MPNHLRFETPDGRPYAERFVDDIKLMPGMSGETMYFPVRAHSQTFGAKEAITSDETLQVDPNSLRVNTDIPDQTFALNPLPNEKIFNADTRRYQSNADIPSTTAP